LQANANAVALFIISNSALKAAKLQIMGVRLDRADNHFAFKQLHVLITKSDAQKMEIYFPFVSCWSLVCEL
jgi:hypothetical protein